MGKANRKKLQAERFLRCQEGGNLTQTGSAEGFLRVFRKLLQKGTQDIGTWKSCRGEVEGGEKRLS